MIIPARKTYLLLIVALVIAPILSMILGIYPSVIITALFDIAVFTLMVIDGASIRDNRVQITRELSPRLSIARDNPIKLKVTMGKRNGLIHICDDYPQAFTASSNIVTATLAAHENRELTYTVYPSYRGEFSWGGIQVRQLGNWGLGWDDWRIPQNTSVKVYPDLVGLRSLSIALTLQSSGNLRQTQQTGIGTEFIELRNYRTGDDLRLIDWKATARRTYGNNQPLVRVLAPEREQTLIILLDKGRLMTAQVGGLKRFDWGLNTTLSLALAALHRGDKVGICVFDNNIHMWIPPERGQNHLNRLIDNLTPIQPGLVESDYLNAVTYVLKQQTRRALLVVITDLIDITASSELLAALSKLAPRYLPFCVTLRDAQTDNLANTFTEDASQSYIRAVALDLLAQRELAFSQLKQKGVLVLDAPAHQISQQLVDRYLQLKAHNQL